MITKYWELSDEFVAALDADELRSEYRHLRDHHVAETRMLIEKLVEYHTTKCGPSVIVIGPDRVGKTTLTALISAALGIPSFKCPAEKRIFKEGGRSSLSFDYTLTHFLSQTGHRFVSDRGYPCEWVYSRVFGRETDDGLLELIDRGHEHLGTKILYLYSSVPPTEEDDLVPAEKYWDVKRTYDSFCEWTSCGVAAVDVAAMLEAYRWGSDVSREFADSCIELMGLSKKGK